MEIGKVLTSKDQVVFRVVSILVFFVSPLGFLLVNYHSLFMNMNLVLLFILMVISSTPFLIISYFSYFKRVDIFEEMIETSERTAKKISKNYQDFSKFFISIELKGDIKKEWDNLMQNFLSIQSHVEGILKGNNDFLEALKRYKKGVENDRDEFLVHTIWGAPIIGMYVINSILSAINYFVEALSLAQYVSFSYLAYLLYFEYTYARKFFDARRRFKIQHRMLLRTKKQANELKKLLPFTKEAFKLFKKYEQEAKGLNEKSRRYKEIKKKYAQYFKKMQERFINSKKILQQ